MGAREEGYYGPPSSDLGCGTLICIAVLVLAVLLLAVLCFMSVGDAGADAAVEASGECPARTDFAIDVTDQWAMHDAGLPTKADVLAWHMYGRWGFYRVESGMQEVHIWHDLPGAAWIWDALYGLDPDNPAFKFKGDERHDYETE